MRAAWACANWCSIWPWPTMSQSAARWTIARLSSSTTSTSISLIQCASAMDVTLRPSCPDSPRRCARPPSRNSSFPTARHGARRPSMPEPLTCVSDLRALARRRVPRALFEYADRGAFDELTLYENRAALDALHLKPRIMIDVDERSLSTTLAGQKSSLPHAIAPTRPAGLQYGGCQVP